MKKLVLLAALMLLSTGCVFATTQEAFDALKSCSDFNNGAVKIHEISVGSCSYIYTVNGKTTTCSMPTSMARKLSIFKTAESLNEAQVADMKDIESKYCKTK